MSKQKENLSQLRSEPLYYSLGGNITSPRRLVLSLIFPSTHHRGDMEASVGTCAFHCLSPPPDERGFPVWYAVKVIWIAVMFLYNMHCQAKTGKTFSTPTPPKLISAMLFIITTTNILHLCDHNSPLSEQQHNSDAFWSEMKTKSLGDSKKPLGHCWSSVWKEY